MSLLINNAARSRARTTAVFPFLDANDKCRIDLKADNVQQRVCIAAKKDVNVSVSMRFQKSMNAGKDIGS